MMRFATTLLMILCYYATLIGAQSLEERLPCMDQTDERAQQSAARTTGTCSAFNCPGGCCRYHTAFLTCDTRNLYAHQQCICNERTAPRPPRPGNNPPSPPGNSPPGNSPPDNRSPPGNSPPGNPITPPGNSPPNTPPANPPGAAGRCENGSVWQTLGLPFENCAAGADCAGVMSTTSSGGSRPTCCKRAFCWCGVYDVEAEECVA